MVYKVANYFQVCVCFAYAGGVGLRGGTPVIPLLTHSAQRCTHKNKQV